MSHVPFSAVPEAEIPSEEEFTFQVAVDDGPSEEEPAGAGTYVYLVKEGFSKRNACSREPTKPSTALRASLFNNLCLG